ncbi:glycosyl transferase [Adhaeribacter aerolatus]|uniref:Glycosyl transferase n=1 Tax=Adhaeribacter aerolatus TaxID=670289 RepID=A0A512B485_9BACT|nr:glycosyltransferase family 2 protein [Adhaeribacter aerolatus]GEO06768.1 glycosyl transferase [Adhaeribacter aerolatus]
MVSDSAARVAIVILNWNGQKFLQKFLPVVIAYSPGCQVVVADNASSDDSVLFLQKEFPAVKLILHSENYGFCEGYNRALGQVNAEYYVLLNSDVEVTPNWLDPIISLLDSDARIAACQPKIKSYYKRNCFEYAGAAGGLIDYLGYPFCRGRLFETIEEDKGQYNDVRPIFWATGACLFIRATAYWEAQGLEPAFFAHMEEIDLCWRLQLMGYKIMYCGHSEIFHVGGGTLPKNSPRKTYLNFRNGLALLYKNIGPENLYKILITRIVLDWVAAFKFLITGFRHDALAVLRAHWHLWQNRKYWQKRRAQIQHQAVISPELIYPKSLVGEYFLNGIKTYPQLNIPNRAALPA